MPYSTEAALPAPTELKPKAQYHLVANDPLPPEVNFRVSHWKHIALTIPPDLKVSHEDSLRLLLALGRSTRSGVEVIGTPKRIIIEVVALEHEADFVIQQIKSNFPSIELTTEGEHLITPLLKDGNSEHWVENTEIIEHGLKEIFLFPLDTWQKDKRDIWPSLAASLSNLAEGETGVFQVLFSRTACPWVESIIRLTKLYPDYFDSHKLRQVREKISSPLFAVVARTIGQAKSRKRARQIAFDIGSALKILENPSSNKLAPFSNKLYEDSAHFLDVLDRASQRSGMILNAEELVSLVHLPTDSVRCAKLRTEEKEEANTKAVPKIATGHDVVLGENSHNTQTAEVTLSSEQRTKHTYIIGAPGSGKSTLLVNLTLQDIEQGRGVAVLDPHGDLIDQILERIPEHRHQDVILFDPADSDFPVGLNILSAHSEAEKELLASDLVATFRRLSTSWGDQMNSVLANAILAFLESEEGGTLLDLRRFLIDKEYRSSVIATVNEPEISFYWQKEYPLLPKTSKGPLLTRLDTFTRPKLVRYLIAQKENKIDFSKVMNEGKIFLGKLAQGMIGEENAYLLGSFLISKFQQAALGRQVLPESQRKDFFLHIDEFHNFLTPSLVTLLQSARKYHVGLTLAHQEIHQLWKEDSVVASAVLSNPYTRICFRVGDYDAQKLQDGFSFFDKEDLQNLGTGEAICRVGKAEHDFNLKTKPLTKIDSETAKRRHEQIRTLSRKSYATARSEVEAELRKRYVINEPEPEPVKPKPSREESVTKKSEPPPKVEPAQEVLDGSKVNDPLQDKLDRQREKLKKKAQLLPTNIPDDEEKAGHQQWQHHIRLVAQEKGYYVEIEKLIEDGKKIDATLEKDGAPSIACEVSITNTPDYEIQNIEKCLRAKFDIVVFLCPDLKKLEKVEKLAKDKFEESELSRIQFIEAKHFWDFLEELTAKLASGKVENIKGYKITTNWGANMTEEEKAKAEQQNIDAAWGKGRGSK